ncbi:Sulfate transporter/antisigma-factor antagonist STAS (plasmid) [Thalassoporum mexicanum PCC 7367]|uniref:STAS domain-containing protein n=1 Tax=Thalassoporum mexicanum TaxID=3457544 RepID=UPI00029FDA6A|nr:STAS domain-containing protein [Pseudanabaena sp. PCC 7367]AFY72158.1 Sulfate transporter/antisigma-factor antagonist STAS [Pseudanabaena sp. PCC 7367]
MVEKKNIKGFPRVKVIKPSGKIDRSNYQQFYLEAIAFVEELTTNLNHLPIYLIIDLQDIKVIDGTGLGALIKLLKELRKDGSRLALCSVSPNIETMLKLTATYNIFNVLATKRDLLSKLKHSQSNPANPAIVRRNNPPTMVKPPQQFQPLTS